MNRSLAALAAAAMLLSTAPTLGFADEGSSSSSTSSVTSSSSSSASSEALEKGNEWMAPCMELKGLMKAQCIVKHNPGKGNKKKDRVARHALERALQLSSDCADKEGTEKIECVRENGRHGLKHLVRKAAKTDLLRTIRGKLQSSSSSSESSED